jgi:hypothetical protein
MNAKNMLKILEKCAADARECFPNDARNRCNFFTLTLSNELDLVGEPLGPRIRALSSPLSDADRAAIDGAGSAA